MVDIAITTRLNELSRSISEAKARGLEVTDLIAEHQALSTRAGAGRPSRNPKSAPPTLRVLTDLAEFRELEPAWQDLLDHSEALSPFLTQSWLVPWLQTYNTRHDLRIALAEENGQIVAALPLMVGDERRGVTRGRTARFVGTGEGLRGDFFCFPVREGASAKALGLVQEHLRGLLEDGVALHLEEVSPFEDGWETLRLLLQQGRSRFELRAEFPCIYGRLPATFEEFIAQVPASTRRNRLRRGDAPLRDACDCISYAECDDAAQIGAFLDALGRFSCQRRQLEGQVSTWANPTHMQCRRQVAEAFLERGMLRLDLLLCGGEPIAAVMGIVYRDTYFCYNMGLNQAYARHEPGHVLLAWRLRRSIEEGLTGVNFLVGEAEYKRQYFRDSLPELTLTCRNPAWRRMARGMRDWARAAGLGL